MNNKPYKYTIQYKMGLVKASEVDISGSVHEKTPFEKIKSLKICIVIEIYKHK